MLLLFGGHGQIGFSSHQALKLGTQEISRANWADFLHGYGDAIVFGINFG